MSDMPVIDRVKCDNCGLCIGVCTCKSLVVVANMVIIIESEECDWCTLCEAVCPTGAITCAFEIVIEEYQ